MPTIAIRAIFFGGKSYCDGFRLIEFAANGDGDTSLLRPSDNDAHRCLDVHKELRSEGLRCRSQIRHLLCGVADARLNIVFEDERLLVLNKPAGLVCHPTKGDEYSSLVGRVRIHLGPEYHLINRLDRETSGLVLIAKQDTAARALRRAWESRTVRKIYFAIVHGHIATEGGRIAEPLGRDLNSHVAIKDCVRADGLAAETTFRVAERFEKGGKPFSYLEVEPHSGRKHQIRIHLAHLGHPIVGDKIYGGDEMLYIDFIADRLTDAQRKKLILPHHALHAQRLEFPLHREQLAFEAPAEEWFTCFLPQP